MESTTIPHHACPVCGYTAEAATSLASMTNDTPVPQPSAGDISVCFGCGAIGVFDAQMKLTIPDDGELLDLMLNNDWADIVRTQRSIRAFRHHLGERVSGQSQR